MPSVLNIGCGTHNREKFEIGIDIALSIRPDVCGNIERLPFKDESFELIKAIHVMEHVNDIESVMDECWRVLRYNGQMVVGVPLYPSDDAVGDPTHKRFFIPRTFAYFCVKGKLPNLKHVWQMNQKGPIEDTKDHELVCMLKKVRDA